MPLSQLVVVAHTHWDREWYLPFQTFRVRLVALMDQLLDAMEAGEGPRYFTLDGQTVILEDYLAVRPERADAIRRLVREGRLLVGPWYVQPDEFLVSGEALVRNLLRGRAVADQFGGAMQVGYLPDSFGHTAQMPQILRGFGIEDAVIWRGVGEEAKYDQFLWRALDGSEVLAQFLPEGYDNALRLPLDPEPLMELIDHIRGVLEVRSPTGVMLLMNGDDHLPAQLDVGEAIATANARLEHARLQEGTLPAFYAALRQAARDAGVSFAAIEGELRSPRFSHVLPGVLSSRMWIKQRNAASQTLLERWAEPFSTYAGLTGASPRPAALLRLAWQSLLQNQAHDSICGCGVDQVHEEMRVRFDASDQVAQAVTEQALGAIAEQVRTLAVPAPVGYGRPASSPLASALVVFNSEGGPRTDYVTATLQLPGGVDDVAVADEAGRLLPSQVLRERKVEEFSRTLSRAQVRGLLRLAGLGQDWTPERARRLEEALRLMAGSKLPHLIVEDVVIRPGQDGNTVLVEAQTAGSGEHNYDALADGLRDLSALIARGDVEYVQVRAQRRDEVEVGFVAEDVPGHGYRTFQLLPGHRSGLRGRVPVAGDTIENEFFSVRASAQDGTLTVLDKRTGAMNSGLNLLVDGADAGDEYNYSPPENDRLIEGPVRGAQVEVLEAGPVRSTLRIAYDLLLPPGLTPDRQGRALGATACPVVVEASLFAHVPRIDITTTLDNRVTDHRLRAIFPTRIVVDHAHAEGQFAVVERAVEVAAGGDAWLETPGGSHPQGRFVDVSDGDVGLAVANRGLPEYEVLPGRDGVAIALTLLRCVGWLSRDDLATRRGSAGPFLPTPGAQMPGEQRFAYSLVPHAGDWEEALAQAHWHASPLRAVATGVHAGALPPSASFVSVEPAGLAISAFKTAEDGDGAILRLYNPGGAPALARIETAWPVSGAHLCTLDETPISALQPDADTLRVPVRAAQVVSLRLRFGA